MARLAHRVGTNAFYIADTDHVFSHAVRRVLNVSRRVDGLAAIILAILSVTCRVLDLLVMSRVQIFCLAVIAASVCVVSRVYRGVPYATRR